MLDTQNASSDAPLSLDAATALLAEPPPKEDEDQQQPEAAAKAPAQPEQEAAPEEPEAEAELEAEPEEDPEPAPQIDPPRSWSKEDAAAWAQLPPQVQEIVARREADRDKAVSVATQRTQEVTNIVTQIAERYQQFAPQMVDQLTAAEKAFDAKWGDVDWATYARTDFENYQLHRAEFEAERADLERYAGDVQALTAEQQRASELARQHFLAEQSERLKDLAPELVSNGERRAAVGAFLIEQGFEPTILRDISAAELAIANDAMKWREAQKAAKSAAAAPRKPAAPSKAPGPTTTGGVTPARALQGMETKLTKSGSLDDAVALLVARSARKK